MGVLNAVKMQYILTVNGAMLSCVLTGFGWSFKESVSVHGTSFSLCFKQTRDTAEMARGSGVKSL
jgi:hypothetical protein